MADPPSTADLFDEIVPDSTARDHVLVLPADAAPIDIDAPDESAAKRRRAVSSGADTDDAQDTALASAAAPPPGAAGGPADSPATHPRPRRAAAAAAAAATAAAAASPPTEEDVMDLSSDDGGSGGNHGDPESGAGLGEDLDDIVSDEQLREYFQKRLKRKSEVDSDGDPLYCECRSADTEGWMILCETCGDWFHGECVQLDPKYEKEIDFYNCPECQLMGNVIVWISKPPRGKNTGNVRHIPAYRKRYSRIFGDPEFEGAGGEKPADDDDAPRAKRQASRRAGARHQDEHLPLCSRSECFNTMTSEDSTKTGGFCSERCQILAAPHRLQRLLRKRAKTLRDAKRAEARASGKKSDTGGERASKTRMAMLGALKLHSDDVETCESLARAITNALEDRVGDADYASQVRSIVFNLRDRKNPHFRERVLKGEISPKDLATMRPEAMASTERAQWRSEVEGQLIKQSVRSKKDENINQKAAEYTENVIEQPEGAVQGVSLESLLAPSSMVAKEVAKRKRKEASDVMDLDPDASGDDADDDVEMVPASSAIRVVGETDFQINDPIDTAPIDGMDFGSDHGSQSGDEPSHELVWEGNFETQPHESVRLRAFHHSGPVVTLAECDLLYKGRSLVDESAKYFKALEKSSSRQKSVWTLEVADEENETTFQDFIDCHIRDKRTAVIGVPDDSGILEMFVVPPSDSPASVVGPDGPATVIVITKKKKR